MSLQSDQAWFEQNRAFISQQYPGLYVVVKDATIVGAYSDYATAYNSGVAIFGTQPFVVKQATPTSETKMNYLIGRRFPRMFMGQQYAAANQVDQLRQSGAIVNVQISIPSALAAQLQAQGKPVPPPQVSRAMIDTGASISTVSDQIAAAAGLQPVGEVPLGGVGGMSNRTIFAASFSLTDYGLTVDPTEIAGVTIGAPGFDVLLGRDILTALHLDYQGRQGAFTLTQDETEVKGPTPSVPTPGAPSAAPSGKTLAVVGGVAAVAVAGLFLFDVL